jgi:hypothetical protein
MNIDTSVHTMHIDIRIIVPSDAFVESLLLSEPIPSFLCTKSPKGTIITGTVDKMTTIIDNLMRRESDESFGKMDITSF